MKYSFFLFALVTSFFVRAQDLTEAQLPGEVKKTFTAAYPSASEVKWEKKKELYKAGFKTGKTDHDVWLSADGKVTKHRFEIKKEELPAVITETIKKDFSSYKIDDCEKTEAKGIASYKVELKSDAGKKNVHFDADGKMITKKNDD